MVRPASTLLLVMLGLSAGCDGPGITPPGLPADVRAYVTGAAAANLDGNSRFVLPEPVSPTPLAIITADRARALAEADVRTSGAHMESTWEKTRGGPIDVDRLQADTRVQYVPTPYALIPDGFHSSTRRAMGPYYLVRMVTGETTILLIGVSAYATEVGIDAEGRVQRPPLGRGAEFIEHPLPKDTALLRVFSPEEAVVLVGTLTGARVSEVPQLVRRSMPLSPTVALWKLTLDRAVRVRTVQGSRTVETRELYVSPESGARIVIPTVEQPASYLMTTSRVGPDGVSTDGDSLRVPVVNAALTAFEPVVLAPPP